MAHKHLKQDNAHPATPGITIDSPRAYELAADIGLLGWRQRLFTRLVQLSGAGPGNRVLDVGCGTGYFTQLAAKAVTPGGTAMGVDPSPAVIKYARAHRAADNCNFQSGIAEAIDAADGSFDVVISSFMVHHLPSELRLTAVREMSRVLRPGGRLLIADFQPPRSRLGRGLVRVFAHQAMQHNPRHQLEKLFHEAGFEAVQAGALRPFTHYVTATKPRARR